MNSLEKMTPLEHRAVVSLSTIMSLRMLGLFAVVPIFSLYAQHLAYANAQLIGWGMGIYGLSQALLQIPFGTLSDRFGRKKIMTIGLLIFILGSLVCAFSHTIYALIIGRFLQGAGAIGSTTLAFIADLTRENQRTKSMAIAGISIGFSFLMAMMLGPMLIQWITFNSLFIFSAGFGLLAIFLLYSRVPNVNVQRFHRDTQLEWSSFLKLLIKPELFKLNAGIFILHAVFTASFVVIPIALKDIVGLSVNQQWLIYVPTLLLAFLLSMTVIGASERKQTIKVYFVSSIILLAAAFIILSDRPAAISINIVALCCFFTGFSLLEAFLPSQISKEAPADCKGTAMGIYSSAQFCGIFIGGVLGGWLYGTYGFNGVYFFCLSSTLLWLMFAFSMRVSSHITQLLKLSPATKERWVKEMSKLRSIPGIIEVIIHAEDGIAYLKMDRHTAKHPDFIRLKEQLQSK